MIFKFDDAIPKIYMSVESKVTDPPTVPLFFPLPLNPPLSSIPAQSPGFPSISPRYLSVPSKPSDSILTLSPTSNAFLGLPTTSEWRLGGRLIIRADVGVFARSEILLGAALVEETEATEDGRPTTDRRPEDNGYDADWGDKDVVELRLGCGMLRCSDGSFALIASAKARDISSTGVIVELCWCTVEEDRDLPGVGILLIRPGPGIPDCLGLPGVVMSKIQVIKALIVVLKLQQGH